MTDIIIETDTADLSNASPRDAFMARIGKLGGDFGRGQKTMADFMHEIAVGVRDGAIAAKAEDGEGDDLAVVMVEFERRAKKANAFVKLGTMTSKVRKSEFRQIMLASGKDGVNFPDVLARVVANWAKKAENKKKRRQIEACLIMAAREQLKVDAPLSDDTIDGITRKPDASTKPVAKIITEFRDRMVKLRDDKNVAHFDEDDKEDLQALLDACTPWIVVPETDKVTALTAQNDALQARLAALEAMLNAKVLPDLTNGGVNPLPV